MPRFASDYRKKAPRFAYLRSLLPVLASLLVFSFLLASYSLLSHFRSPAAKQQIGWQAWDVVDLSGLQSDQDVLGGSNSTDEWDWDWGDDWAPSIPLDNWVSTGLWRVAS
jgi:hypothetical protein